MVVALSVLALLTLLLPWERTGSTERSGYSLARAVDSAGLATGGFEHALLDAVFALPVVVGLACGISLFGRLRLAAFLAAYEGCVVVLASVVVLTQFSAVAEIGPSIAIALGGLTVAVSAAQLAGKRGHLVRRS